MLHCVPVKQSPIDFDGSTEPQIEFGCIRFTRMRVEKLRNGQRILAFPREGVTRVLVLHDSASEYPGKETAYAIGFALLGIAVLADAIPGKKLGNGTMGAVFVAIAIALLVHLLRRVTQVRIERQGGMIHLAVEKELTEAEIADINRRIGVELGWPAKSR